MDRKTYKAFTLIEMLIVMGILIILMVIGVAAGRFAINRANDIAHQNGANQIYQALQAYYTDKGSFPQTTESISSMIADPNSLGKYMDTGAFKGGSEASYFYFTNANKQAALVCVTLGGLKDDTRKGVVCVGNGFNDANIQPADMANLTGDKIEVDNQGEVTNGKDNTETSKFLAVYNYLTSGGGLSYSTKSVWCGKAWGTGSTCAQ